MKKIIVLGLSLNDDQKSLLESLGSVAYQKSPETSDEFIQLSTGADVIFSDGSCLLDSLPKLKNVFVTYPYIELGVFNSEELAKNGVYVANAQGGNRDSIVEWTIYMVLSLFRQFGYMVRAAGNFPVELRESLVNKKVLIVGHGSIGSRVGELCLAFGMHVDFFNRGDDLLPKSSGVNMIINCLNCNTTSKNLLNENFFMSLNPGTYYVTFVRPFTYDIDGLIKSINSNIVAGAAIDCDPENFGDTSNAFYQKCLANQKILVTPHIAFSTKQAIANGRNFAIQNIDDYLSGSPKNILTKN